MSIPNEKEVKEAIEQIINSECCGDWTGAVDGAMEAARSIVKYLKEELLLKL